MRFNLEIQFKCTRIYESKLLKIKILIISRVLLLNAATILKLELSCQDNIETCLNLRRSYSVSKEQITLDIISYSARALAMWYDISKL